MNGEYNKLYFKLIKLNFFRDKSTKGFIDMNVDGVDTNNIYVATNSTNILHATCLGGKTNPPVYKINEMGMSVFSN